MTQIFLDKDHRKGDVNSTHFCLLKNNFNIWGGWLARTREWGLNSWVGPASSPLIQFIMKDLTCCTKKHWE